jgi:tRNA threonylcarbamoyladenosine biosynthesis protein TsaB
MAARCRRAAEHQTDARRRDWPSANVVGLSAMKILAMDTAAGACSGALWSDAVVVERVQLMQRGHAEALLPMLASIMREAGCAFEELDLIAVTVGPGAFTGLRVGLAAARGIALASSLPCFGVSTLEAIAEAIDWPTLANRPALVVLDNKRDGVYAQLFGAGRALAPPSIETPKGLGERFSGRHIAVAGDGVGVVMTALRGAGSNIESIAIPEYPTASRVAAIAGRRWISGERTGASPAPVYLRPPATGPQQARTIGT